jgi:hypothetical protein
MNAYERSDSASPIGNNTQEAVDDGYRFTLARLLIDTAKDELRRNPAFTRALADRYFTNIGGMPNDASRYTAFVQNDAHYLIGYEYRFDNNGGWRERVEIIRQVGERQERLAVEAAQHLAEASNSRFVVDGHITFTKTEAAEGAAISLPTDAYTAAEAIVHGLCAAPEPPREG